MSNFRYAKLPDHIVDYLTDTNAYRIQLYIIYINPKALRLRVSWAPTIMWSITLTFKGLSALMISRVIAMSALDGVGSPDG